MSLSLSVFPPPGVGRSQWGGQGGGQNVKKMNIEQGLTNSDLRSKKMHLCKPGFFIYK